MKFRSFFCVIFVTIFLQWYGLSAMSGSSEFDIINNGESVFHFSIFPGKERLPILKL